MDANQVVERPLHAVTGEALADERVNPFLQRLQLLWDECLDAVKNAKGAVKVHQKADGTVAFDGRDFGPLAAMLNQAHRNVELFGKGTGALTDSTPVQIDIQSPGFVIVNQVGASQAAAPVADAGESTAIDAECVDLAILPEQCR